MTFRIVWIERAFIQYQKKVLSIFKSRDIKVDVAKLHAHIAARMNTECTK